MNKLLIAGAGSGKTTFLVNQALGNKNQQVLITTYTKSNEAEIKNKFIKRNGYIPGNITIQTWFSFLLQHGVRPFQSLMDEGMHERRVGFYLTERKSGLRYYNKQNKRPVYWGEDKINKYYFTNDLKIYSDKISKFIVKCNSKSKGDVVKRISRLFPNIYIDEVQDLAGWDLDIIKLLFTSKSSIFLVGDPRQVTYLTHIPAKYKKYKDGSIKKFIEDECKRDICVIDETTLSKSHRNNKHICYFSSALYGEHSICVPCECESCKKSRQDHQGGIFVVKSDEIDAYCRKYNPQILRHDSSIFPDLNFGFSKGLSFDNVLIYPTDKIRKYLLDGNTEKIRTIKAKFYVAITRARHSVGIVFDYNDDVVFIEGIEKFQSCK